MEGTYTDKVDIWSLGCVLAEIQGLIKENCPAIENRQALFPGGSCFPLSPTLKQQDEEQHNKKLNISDKDQLNLILKVLGPLKENDISFIKD